MSYLAFINIDYRLDYTVIVYIRLLKRRVRSVIFIYLANYTTCELNIAGLLRVRFSTHNFASCSNCIVS